MTCDHDGQTYAEHSGDRQDAPPPEGASEFIDIDAKVAKAAGARYVVATVLCYNGGISFDDLTAAYTGMMIRSDAKAAVYDPRTVTHRFAISGQYRGYVPIVFDLVDSEIIVADASISQRSSGNVNTLSASKELFETLANVVPYSRHLAYPSRYEIACMHAAARCERVIVRLAGGKAALYSRGAGESDVAFYRRMIERIRAVADAAGDAKFGVFVARRYGVCSGERNVDRLCRAFGGKRRLGVDLLSR